MIYSEWYFRYKGYSVAVDAALPKPKNEWDSDTSVLAGQHDARELRYDIFSAGDDK